MENRTNYEGQIEAPTQLEQPPTYSIANDESYQNLEHDNEGNDQIEPELNPNDPESPPPPSYSIAKEEDALARFHSLEGLVFVLKEDKIKLYDQDEIVYLLSHDPRSGTGELFSFNLRVYKYPGNDISRPKVAREKELYRMKDALTWFKFGGSLPPWYTFTAESRSFYCYRPEFSMICGNTMVMRWSDLLPWASKDIHSPWRVHIHTNFRKKNDEALVIVRKRKSHKTDREYEWILDGSCEVLALETDDCLSGPTIELKTNPKERRLIHALILAWITRIWFDANKEYVERKAQEINKTLTCKFIHALITYLPKQF
jgi:hypothetical protein